MITTDELNDLIYLPGEIKQIDKAINDLEHEWRVIPANERDYADNVNDCIEVYRDRRRGCIVQLEKLRAFMGSIQDPFIRELFQLRYEKGKEWIPIYFIMSDRGYYCSEDSLKKSHQRYLERYNKNEAEKETWAAAVL